jgi:hypothetical protein
MATTVDAVRPRAGTGTALRPGLAAGVLIALGFGYRCWLLATHVPATDSDEATMGLAALHIARLHDFPVFLYGQHYMGVVEAYLAAPFVALAGPSTAALRLPTLLLSVVFLGLMYRLTSRLYSPWFAVFAVGLLALGSDRLVKDQLVAHGGSAEIKPAAAGLMLLAVGLAQRRIRRPALGFAGWGLLAGLALWTHWLILPYLAVALVVLVAGTGWHRHWWWLLGGFVVGAAPLIAYNLTAAPGQDSVSVFLRLNGGPATTVSARLSGGILLGVPLATGACHPAACTGWERAWGPTFLVLMAVAGVLALIALRRRGRDVGQQARLGLLFAAGLSVLAYTRSPAAALSPLESARYLSCLPVSLPAVLWPLWRAARYAARRDLPPWPVRRWLAALTLAAVAATMVDATVALARSADRVGAADTRQAQLVAALDRAGLNRVYSEYWTRARLSYASAERIDCAVVGDDLRAGLDRIPSLATPVQAAAQPAYTFPAGSTVDRTFRRYLDGRDVAYTVTEAGGYHIYRVPLGAGVPLPGTDPPPLTD